MATIEFNYYHSVAYAPVVVDCGDEFQGNGLVNATTMLGNMESTLRAHGWGNVVDKVPAPVAPGQVGHIAYMSADGSQTITIWIRRVLRLAPGTQILAPHEL